MKGFVAVLVMAASSAALAAGMVEPTVTTRNFRCWHDVRYGSREDLPDEGSGFSGRIGNWGVRDCPWRMATHRTAQAMDIYAPPGRVATNAVVVLFLHGGAWSHCFDKDAVSYRLVDALMAKGAVMCSAGYILQSDNTLNGTIKTPAREGATFAGMLRDVDGAASRLRTILPLMGVENPRFVIAGESAGAHLALLYAYDQDAPEKLGLGLRHDFRVSKVVSIVGPTDLSTIDSASMLIMDRMLASDRPEESLRARFAILFNRLCGLPDDTPVDALRPYAKKWSPVALVSPKSVPTVLAYAQMLPLVETDGIVPLSQKKELENLLKLNGVRFRSRVFMGLTHADVSFKGADWIAARAVE